MTNEIEVVGLFASSKDELVFGETCVGRATHQNVKMLLLHPLKEGMHLQ